MRGQAHPVSAAPEMLDPTDDVSVGLNDPASWEGKSGPVSVTGEGNYEVKVEANSIDPDSIEQVYTTYVWPALNSGSGTQSSQIVTGGERK
jgi:hypothetical protein